jgi:hypothetical protein
MTRWRYEDNCVAYLRSRVGHCEDATERTKYLKLFEEHESDWKNIGQKILERVTVWKRLVLGMDDANATDTESE